MANVRVPITPVVQLAGTNQCWAAAVAMVLGRSGPSSQQIIHMVISEARQRGVPTVPGSDALDLNGGPPALAQAFGLNIADLRGRSSVPDGNYFAGLLRRGPFGLFGRRQGIGFHAIAINWLNGDFASLASTTAHGIDPVAGTHQFSRPLIRLVMPTPIPGADMTGHYVVWQ